MFVAFFGGACEDSEIITDDCDSTISFGGGAGGACGVSAIAWQAWHKQ